MPGTIDERDPVRYNKGVIIGERRGNMGFFYNYDEVPQEGQPRKRGLARLWEMLGREIGRAHV